MLRFIILAAIPISVVIMVERNTDPDTATKVLCSLIALLIICSMID